MTGVDLSQGMIDLARRQEAQHQLGIEYVVGDARELSSTNSLTVNLVGLPAAGVPIGHPADRTRRPYTPRLLRGAPPEGRASPLH
jgi:hypothetical protein